MQLENLREAYLEGKIEKKLYWQIVRENFTSVLPQIQEAVKNNSEIRSIEICNDGVILTVNNGMRHYFFFDETFCRAEAELSGNGDYEKQDMDLVVRYLSKTGGNVVFDIGANAGLYSLNMNAEFRGGKYTLFEPLPTTYKKMLMNLRLNCVDDSSFKPVNAGMSDKKGSFDFYLPGASEAASMQPINDKFYLQNSDEKGNYTGSNDMKKVECKVTTLDSYVQENRVDNIDFIKIDVEGNEKFVLQGGETLKKFHPLVYCELLRKHSRRFGYHPNDAVIFMRNLGYDFLTIHDGKLMAIDGVDEDTVETNFFFATPEQKQIISVR